VEGEAHDTLGSAHAGLSPALDALAVYMATLEISASPFDTERETISRGEAVFTALECQSCHPCTPTYNSMM